MADAIESDKISVTKDINDDKNNIIQLPMPKQNTQHMSLPITTERAATLLQNAGYRGKIEETSTRVYVESASDGWKFRVYFYDDSPADALSPQLSFMLNSGWSISQDDVEKIKEAANSFNRQCRYAKAYIDGNEEYRFTEIEMSHFILDGITDDCFFGYIDMFLGLRRTYLNLCKEMTSNN